MSHDIEIHGNGAAAFVSAREHAWHRLGTVLPDTFDAADAMRYAHLADWRVRTEPLQSIVMTLDGVTTLDLPTHFATVRDNPTTGLPQVLGVVGANYTPIQNEEHADILDTIVDESGAHFETAGSLRGGRQVFLSMKLPHTIQVGGVDTVETYLAACNSHDGSSAFRLLVTPVRIVCANTQAAALRRAKATFSVRHTSGAKTNVQAARDALGLTFAFMEEFQAEADRMIETVMTDEDFHRLDRTLWPVETDPGTRSVTNTTRRDTTLMRLWSDADTNRTIRGTRWAGYQVITEYLDHYAPAPGTAASAAITRAERVVTGTITPIKTRAFDLLKVSA